MPSNFKKNLLLKSVCFIILFSVILLPATNGCISNTNNVSVVEVDCRKATLEYSIPNTPNITTKTSFCSDYMFKPNALGLAIKVFVKEYSNEFNIPEEKIWAMLSGLQIEVSAIPRTVHAAFDVDGKLLKGEVPVNGLALSKNHIWIEAKTSQIWSSALVHELIHIIIWRKNKVHGDPDHEGGQFSGWEKEHTIFIQKMKNILLDMEL